MSSQKDVQHRNKEFVVYIVPWSWRHREENQLRQCSYYKVPRSYISNWVNNFQIIWEHWKQWIIEYFLWEGPPRTILSDLSQSKVSTEFGSLRDLSSHILKTSSMETVGLPWVMCFSAFLSSWWMFFVFKQMNKHTVFVLVFILWNRLFFSPAFYLGNNIFYGKKCFLFFSQNIRVGESPLCGLAFTTLSESGIFSLSWSALQGIDSILIMWQLLFGKRKFVKCLWAVPGFVNVQNTKLTVVTSALNMPLRPTEVHKCTVLLNCALTPVFSLEVVYLHGRN